MQENNYGNFEEPKEPFKTIRKTDVLLEAIQKCEDLMKELNDACVRIGELTKELQFERDRKEDLSYENKVLRQELENRG